jgi:hypothetical protein
MFDFEKAILDAQFSGDRGRMKDALNRVVDLLAPRQKLENEKEPAFGYREARTLIRGVVAVVYCSPEIPTSGRSLLLVRDTLDRSLRDFLPVVLSWRSGGRRVAFGCPADAAELFLALPLDKQEVVLDRACAELRPLGFGRNRHLISTGSLPDYLMVRLGLRQDAA